MSYADPRIVLVTGTTFEPVTLQELKSWLKVDEGDVLEDGVISGLNTAARQRLESEVRRSFLAQTFDQVYDETPCDDYVELERSPLRSVTSITSYTDTDATDSGGTAMSSSEYYVDTASDHGRVVPFNGFPFPSSTRRANGFIVRFEAGYSSESSGVPEQLKTATKSLVAYWYERRGDESLDEAKSSQRPLPTHVKALLEDFDLPEWG